MKRTEKIAYLNNRGFPIGILNFIILVNGKIHTPGATKKS